MAMTGVDFIKQFERRIDKSYNDYYAPEVFEQFLTRALQLQITSKYRMLDEQRRYDEIRSLLVYKRQSTASNGRVMLQPIAVTAWNDVTGVITTAFPHNALVGEQITVNITGVSAVYNASVAVTAITEYTITVAAFTTGAFVKGSVTTLSSITDYMHLFAVTAAYEFSNVDEIQSVQCSPQNAFITLVKKSKLRNGDKITISGIVGSTSLNGDKYLNQVGTKRYQLYEDADVETPTVGNAKYVSGGVITSVRENACFPIKPDMADVQKIDVPSKYFPRYQMADNALIIEPKADLKYVKADYIKLPPFNINPLDNNVDLLLYYSEEFLQNFIDYAARLFALETKDPQSVSMDENQIVINQ